MSSVCVSPGKCLVRVVLVKVKTEPPLDDDHLDMNLIEMPPPSPPRQEGREAEMEPLTSTPPKQEDAVPDSYNPVKLEFPESSNPVKLELPEDHPSPSGPHQATTLDTSSLKKLLGSDNVDTLKHGVETGVRFLDQLAANLAAYTTTETTSWLQNILAQKELAEPRRIVVGVVGNTGAGKSSVINALMDEERLLPTNCLRACTASPTEISYNYSEDPSELYSAEVEFITREEWVKELEELYADLLDPSGDISRDSSNAESDAGVAYAKLKAVYPSKTKEMLAQANPDDLAAEHGIRSVLSSTKLLKATTSKDLYSQLQRYIDSKEKLTGDERKKNPRMEFWPLIKVVRIRTKADALSTGAVIVDLPGVQDSNAARAAVADNYMKQCGGLWIVAPITRAVDDKTAKNLLGNSFRRQMKYDGTLSNVTFICSKTDDILVTEAADSLNLQDQIEGTMQKANDFKRKIDDLKEQLADLRYQRAAYDDTIDEIEASYDEWEELAADLSDGKVVYAPLTKSKKRKRHGRRSDASLSPGSGTEGDSLSDKENSHQQPRTPLTEEQIEEAMTKLKTEKKEARAHKRSLDGQASSIRRMISETEHQHRELIAEAKSTCIKGRNNYSRSSIQWDFALGIKELDQETAAENDDANFDPDEDARDYDTVAAGLPVFCISSRAFQKLSGRLEKDDFDSHGFMLTPVQVPQLQSHAKKLTESGRIAHYKEFLNNLLRLMYSMNLWVTNEGTSSLSTAEKRSEEIHLRKLLSELKDVFDASVRGSVEEMEECLREQIFKSFDSSIPPAIEQAVITADGWGAHRNMGGLIWSTYKATVRRDGVFSGASGPHDFNSELFEPISQRLASGWERAFQRRLPSILRELTGKLTKRLDEFHQSMLARAHQSQLSALLNVGHQVASVSQSMKTWPAKLQARITELQKEASREFTPVIKEAMLEAYRVCVEEHGPGSFARMKAAMGSHVSTARYTMFHQSTGKVKGMLVKLCETVQQEILRDTGPVLNDLSKDYLGAMLGRNVGEAKLSSAEISMRARVKDVLLSNDAMFSPVGKEAAVEVEMEDEEDMLQAQLLQEM
ncbi:hypothetical protein PG999_011231 [Apiospora kogelbergensis]|uniref:Dynamin family protein n=1 Tax=Apiospora kogelbergensis TaxID=1337665 RepID=A0AAW0QK14_9PEZI